MILLGLAHGGQVLFTVAFEGSTDLAHGLTTRDVVAQDLLALETSSLDYYAAMRNAYYQTRMAFIWRREPDRGLHARVKQALAAW